jgi:hypothetical protein
MNLPEMTRSLIIMSASLSHSLDQLGETRHAFRKKAGDDVGLGEVVGRAVDDQRDPLLHTVIELVFQEPVTLLGAAGGYLRDLLLAGVEVDLKMPGGEDLPVEIGILDLILAEIVLPVSRTGEK